MPASRCRFVAPLLRRGCTLCRRTVAPVGTVTLAQIWEERGGEAPLYAVDPESGDISDNVTGTWLLTEAVRTRRYYFPGKTLALTCLVCVSEGVRIV